MLTPAGRYAGMKLDFMETALQRSYHEQINRRGFATVCREFAATDRGDLTAWAGRLERARSDAGWRMAPIVKAAASHDEVWVGADARALARSYLGALSELDALEALRMYGTEVPESTRRVLLASGAEAYETGEGFPKAVSSMDFNEEPLPPMKVVGLVVGNQELFSAADPELTALFENELRKAVILSGNRAVLQSLPTGNVVAGDGNPLGDLSAALAAAGDDNHYIVMAERSYVRTLALVSDGRMGPAGGTFSPGVTVIPIDGDSNTFKITAIPATRCRFVDHGFSVKHAGHATLDLSPTPGSPSLQVSLFQVNARAIAVERLVRLHFTAAPGVVA
jgi:hypothetical protein